MAWFVGICWYTLQIIVLIYLQFWAFPLSPTSTGLRFRPPLPSSPDCIHHDIPPHRSIYEFISRMTHGKYGNFSATETNVGLASSRSWSPQHLRDEDPHFKKPVFVFHVLHRNKWFFICSKLVRVSGLWQKPDTLCELCFVFVHSVSFGIKSICIPPS